MSAIVLVASYPKSGNTWVRSIIQALVARDGGTIDINRLETVNRWASDRDLFERALGLDPDMLRSDEVRAMRPAVLREIAAAAEPDTVYLKAHDADIGDGGSPFPADLPLRVVHVVRHPFDVCISLANHAAMTVDETIAFMADPAAMEGGHDPDHRARDHRNVNQLPQRLGDWSTHTSSYMTARPDRTLRLRYEDLLTAPVAELLRLAAFLGLDTGAADAARAVEATRFDAFAAQERQHGFVERPRNAARFFRAGRAGDGARMLDDDQKAAIAARHGVVARQLGYAL